ncbi:unnamed protein product [Paramecium sonneborni]|uniref:Uncharacterized protein n=1 Tax=Paramecium sonneborni TaxID=65129 RepID=A0A8S1MHS3_9CILI|nr:unnamed protein product [Paramecium sonneborni]
MFKEYFYEVNELESSQKILKSAEKYIVKHLNHVVSDMQFDFELITEVSTYVMI